MASTNARATCHECQTIYNYDPDSPHVCGAGFTATGGQDTKGRGRTDDPKHDAWQAQVLKIAKECDSIMHFHAFDSRKCPPGYPDLHILMLGQKRSIFVEIKVGKDKPSADQLKWHSSLRRCGHEVFCWYPADEAEARRVLGRKSKLEE